MPNPSTPDSKQLIALDDALIAYLSKKRRDCDEDLSSVLRRELGIPKQNAKERNTTSSRRSRSKRTRVARDKRAPQLLTYIEKSSFAFFKTATEKYLAVLSFLYKQNPKSFPLILTIGGTRRRYFGRSPGEIAVSGRGTQPHAIEGTPYWALTNVNKAKKQEILGRVLVRLGYDRVTGRKVSNSLTD